MRKRSWGSFLVVFCGWRECRCSAVARVKWEVVGGVGAVEGRDGGS